MRYYLDTEFDGFGGRLLSLALVGEDGSELYVARLDRQAVENAVPWVRANVLTIIECPGAKPFLIGSADEFCGCIFYFLEGDRAPVIVADWPDDIAYFCRALMTGRPAEMVALDNITFELRRVDVYPTTLPGAVQHNALWDARALKHRLFHG